MKTSLIAALCLLAFAGCKDKDKAAGGAAAAGAVASCYSEANASCREYNEDNLAGGSDSIAKLCTIASSSAKFAMVACPTAKLLGTCTMHEGKDYFYDGYPIAIDKVEADCKKSGDTFARGK